MSAVPDGDLLSPAETAANALHAICDNRFTVAGASENDAALKLSTRDRFSHGANKIRIVARCLGVRAEVAHGVSFREEKFDDLLLVSKTGVIGCDGDSEGLGHRNKFESLFSPERSIMFKRKI